MRIWEALWKFYYTDDRKRWLFSKVFIMPKLQMNDVNVGEHQK
jgi:hypothetical protein